MNSWVTPGDTPSRTAGWPVALAAAASLAVVPATLLAANLPPSATFLNQAAAVIGWGLFCAVVS